MAIDKKRIIYRLKFYGFGFGLGCVLVWATLYSGRDERSSWMPEGRVLQFLESADIVINEKLECEITCKNLPLTFMDSTFWANAEVIFDKSAVKRKPCPEHYIESTITDGRKIAVYIENCETCIDCDAELTAELRSVVDLTAKDYECGC